MDKLLVILGTALFVAGSVVGGIYNPHTFVGFLCWFAAGYSGGTLVKLIYQAIADQ